MSASDSVPTTPTAAPSPLNYILSFLLVGICWGFTTPFIRKAAVNYKVRLVPIPFINMPQLTNFRLPQMQA
jgi:hypothetical protein